MTPVSSVNRWGEYPVGTPSIHLWFWSSWKCTCSCYNCSCETRSNYSEPEALILIISNTSSNIINIQTLQNFHIRQIVFHLTKLQLICSVNLHFIVKLISKPIIFVKSRSHLLNLFVSRNSRSDFCDFTFIPSPKLNWLS